MLEKKIKRQREVRKGERERWREEPAERHCCNKSFLGQNLVQDNYGNGDDSRAQGVL